MRRSPRELLAEYPTLGMCLTVLEDESVGVALSGGPGVYTFTILSTPGRTVEATSLRLLAPKAVELTAAYLGLETDG